MRLSHALLGSLVVVAGINFAFGQSVETLKELQLGPIVPLGSNANPEFLTGIELTEPLLGPIVPISGTIPAEIDKSTPSPLKFPNDETQYLSGAEAMPNLHFGFVPIRVIGRPLTASWMEPNSPAFSQSAAGPIHPDRIRNQLSAIADQLATCGLEGEARQIQDLNQRFQKHHYQRMLIAHKESQLKKLQAEIASLKEVQSPASRETFFSLRGLFVELNSKGRKQLIQKLAEQISARTGSQAPQINPEATAFQGVFEFDTQDIQPIVDQLLEQNFAKIIAEPKACVLGGRNVRFLMGGETAIAGADGQTAFRPSHTSFVAQPKLMASGKIRLGLVIEFQDSDVAATGRDGTGRNRRIETVLDIDPGFAATTLISQSQDQLTGETDKEQLSSILFILTPEVVTATRFPNSAQPHATMPTPSPSYHPLVEARAIVDQ